MIPDPVTVGKITLRPWEPDEAGLYLALRDEEIFRFTTEDPSVGEEAARCTIAAARDNPVQVPFAICDAKGDPIGNLALIRRGKSAEISYWLAAPARGRGWASSALRSATEWAFDHWDVRQAELEIDPQNQASIRVAEAAGYRHSGIRLESACGGPAAVYRRPA